MAILSSSPPETETTTGQIKDHTEPETGTKPSLKAPLSPGNPPPVGSFHQPRSVRYCQSVSVLPVLHRNDYTPHEIADTWYTAKEFETIRKDILKILALMRKGRLVEGDESSSSNPTDSRTKPLHDTTSSRGLENYTAKGTLKSSVRKLRQNAIWAVMEEQDLQVDRAEALRLTYLFYDDADIREVYRVYSKGATEAARLRGKNDFRIASYERSQGSPSVPSSHQKSLSNFFRKSSSEKNLQKLSSPSPEKSHTKRRRRWSLLTSTRTSPDTTYTVSDAESRGPKVLVA